MEDIKLLQEKVKEEAEKKGIVILAHHYQRREIKEVAHYVGDSLQLVKYFKDDKRKIGVFATVYFMAETASIYASDLGKEVYIVNPKAGCGLAESITAHQLRNLKGENPEKEVAVYVNTYADVKAEADVVVTSAAAVEVLKNFDEMIFVPDYNLARFVEERLGKEYVKWNGSCYVHRQIKPEHILEKKEVYPEAKVMVHPEADPACWEVADFVGGTGGMIKYVEKNRAYVDTFIVGTEIDMATSLKMLFPELNFVPAREDAICYQMKMSSLKKLYEVVKNLPEENRVLPPGEFSELAKRSIDRMYELVGR